MFKPFTLLAGVFFLLTTNTWAIPTKWDVHVAWPAGNFHTKGVQAFADLVNKQLKAEIDVTIHAGGALGYKGQEILRVTRNGTLKIAEVLMGNVEGDEPIFGLTSLPLLAKDFSDAKNIYQQSRSDYEKVLGRHGLILLYASPWPPGGIFSKNKINTLKDLKTLKIRTYDANSAEFVRKLGAYGFAIPYSELYTALSTGMVNGVLTSTVTGVDSKLWEVTKYFTKINYAFPLNMVILNKTAFNKLSKEAQKVILKSAKDIEERQWVASKTADTEAEKELRKRGMTVVTTVSGDTQKTMQEVAQQLQRQWMKKFAKGKEPQVSGRLIQSK